MLLRRARSVLHVDDAERAAAYWMLFPDRSVRDCSTSPSPPTLGIDAKRSSPDSITRPLNASPVPT